MSFIARLLRYLIAESIAGFLMRGIVWLSFIGLIVVLPKIIMRGFLSFLI